MTIVCNCNCNCNCKPNICSCKNICNSCCSEQCTNKEISYHENTYVRDDCFKNLQILENQFLKIKNSTIKYIGLVSELASIAKQQSDKSLNKIDKIIKNFENIQNSFINEMVIACAVHFTDEKDCIPITISREDDIHNNYDSLLYSGLEVPKHFNILINCEEKINIFNIPSLRIELNKNNFLTLKLREIQNTSSLNKMFIFNHTEIISTIYNLSHNISDINSEFFRDIDGHKVTKEKANLEISFKYLLEYFYGITGYINVSLYNNLHLENVIDEIDLIINHIKSVKRSPILHS